jgi:hypothetical protein
MCVRVCVCRYTSGYMYVYAGIYMRDIERRNEDALGPKCSLSTSTGGRSGPYARGGGCTSNKICSDSMKAPERC